MTTETILTDGQIDDAQEAAYRALVANGYRGGMGGFQWDRASARAIEQAVLQSPEVQKMRQALEFYANGEHFIRHDDSAWDTVSGEPQNLYEDEASTATVEDGSFARIALGRAP